MYDYLNEVIEKNKNGLYMLQLPTGIGKTYNVAQSIKRFALDKNVDRKIIYLTPLNKNVDTLMDELKKAYNDDHMFKNQVLRIRSNFDEVREKIVGLDIPEEFKSEKYSQLIELINIYNNTKNKQYLKVISKQINPIERAFRTEIRNRLKKNFKTKNQRLKQIEQNEKYKWIGQLYPAVFTQRRKVLLMSVRKFIEKNSVIVEPSYSFLNSDFIKDSVIFIDEFDATKADIKSKIIDSSIEFTNQYLLLFNKIYRVLKPEYLSKNLKYAYEKSLYKPYYIIEEAEKIAKKYFINLSFKTDNNSIDNTQNFLFKDATFHTVLNNNRHYIRTTVDESENRVKIVFEDRNEFKKNKTKKDISIYAMLREINRFLNRFKGLIYLWAANYCKIENSNRQDNQDLMSIQQAISTILNRLEFTQEQRDLILLEMETMILKDRNRVIYEIYNIYENGFDIFEFKDDDFHNDSTDISRIKVTTTPEKIIRYLSEISTVFAISATAEISTVVGNYDLNYLENRLRKNYHKTPKKLIDKIKKDLNKINLSYEKNVMIISKVENTKLSKNLMKKTLLEIFENKIYANEFFDYFSEITRTDSLDEEERKYYSIRYFKLIETMLRFLKNKDINSALYLSMALPKQQNPKFDQDKIINMFETAKIYLKENIGEKKENSVFILRSEDFEISKENLLKRLSNGEKIFVISTYSTIGAGQNLQYSIKEKNNLVKISQGFKNDNRTKMKDFDAIYLGDYTNMTINTYSKEKIEKTQLIEMLWQIEEIYESGEINFKEKIAHIKLAFNAYKGKDTRFKFNKLFQTKSVKMKATIALLQALGRISRTYLKNPKIYISVEDRVLENLNLGEIEKIVETPEIKALKKLILENNTSMKILPSDEKILNIAEKVSTYTMYSIRTVLRAEWTFESIEFWENLREFVLKYPTIDDIENIDSEFVQFYISLGKKRNKYFYSQYYDFKDIILFLEENKEQCKKNSRAKAILETNKFSIMQMSIEDSKLESILKYKDIKKFFEKKGYATEFKNNNYLMSPALYHNIYKGALGEVAGKYIIEKETNIKLKKIQKPDEFEFFDYMIDSETYVDFKNWKFSYLVKRDKVKKEIFEKMEKIGAKTAYIINIVSDNQEYIPTISKDMSIIEIPRLIDSNGKFDIKSIEALNFVYRSKNIEN